MQNLTSACYTCDRIDWRLKAEHTCSMCIIKIHSVVSIIPISTRPACYVLYIVRNACISDMGHFSIQKSKSAPLRGRKAFCFDIVCGLSDALLSLSHYIKYMTINVIFWRMKSVLALKQLCNIGINMKRKKELSETFMIISNWKTPLVSMVYTKTFQGCKRYLRGRISWLLCAKQGTWATWILLKMFP